MASRRLLLASLLPAALAGCGFRLQGSRPLPEPLQRVYLDSQQPYSVDEPPVETSLRTRLRRRGAVVTGDRGDANAVLTITDLREESNVLSVNTRGRAIEFEIFVEVTFSLSDDEGVLIAPQTLSARRALSFPSEQILPKESEEERLKTFLQDDLAERILLQLEVRLTQGGEG